DRYASRARLELRPAPVAERLAAPDREVQPSIDEADFLAEAGRCLSCGSCFGCQSCAMYCNPNGFDRLVEAAPGAYFTWSSVACEGCGKCIEVCPCGFLSVR
ncbi:MAG TPA: 4Fe-4S binding protein, partial [Thermoanaerobaculia bacterium]|nr:4Fe-4S binding protein [Thermoanaerobaculia bacterium]